MKTVKFGIGSKVKKARGKRVGVISTIYPGHMALVRWYDDFSDEVIWIGDLRLTQ